MRIWLITSLVVLSFFSLAAAPAKQSKAKKTMAVTVVDQATGKPLGGAVITVAYANIRTPLTADDKGAVAVLYDEGANYLVLWCRKDGYVPTYVRWSHNSNDPISLPESYAIKMPAGKTIGGLIVDEDGKPVADAKVILDQYLNPPDAMPAVASGPRDEMVKTDGAGKWTFNGYPADKPAIGIRIQHPDFIADQQFGSGDGKALLDQSLKLTLLRGVEVTGQVVSVRGKPIKGAKVTTVSDTHVSNSYGATVRTDADGKFRFPHLPPQQVPMTVTMVGFAPELQDVTIAAGMAPIKFVLPDPTRLAGRVVDDQGKPVEKVYVNVSEWRGHESLAWSGQTDADGHFAWADAPADAVTFTFNKTGYRYISRKELTATPDEQIVKMLPVATASGTVTDAVTHQPIDQFTVITGTQYWERRPPFYMFSNAKPFTGGKYDLPINANDGTLASYVRIEAKGYKPAISPPITSGNVTFSPELQVGKNIAGTLVDPDGKPVAGASVSLASPGSQIDIYSNTIQRSEATSAKTDEQGHFEFGPQIGEIYYCVVHDAGFAYVKGDSSATKVDLKLTPWSHIEGVFRPGGKGKQHAQINVERVRNSSEIVPLLEWIIDAKIDENGKLTALHVPSFNGDTYFLQFSQYEEETHNSADWTVPLRPEPGKTLQINIEAGRTVTGHVAPATEQDKIADLRGSVLFVPAHEQPPSAWPASLADAAAHGVPHYSVNIRPDGSFSMPSMPPGNYEYFTLFYANKTSAAASGLVKVEPGDGAFDMGTISYVRGGMKAGDPAPATLGRTMDDKTIHTADYAGKYVIAVLWDSNTGRTDAQLSDLNKLAASLATDEKVALLSVNLDEVNLMTVGVRRKPAALENAAWTQAYLSESDEHVMSEIGSNKWPMILIIGPDGKLLSCETEAKDVAEKLAGFRK